MTIYNDDHTPDYGYNPESISDNILAGRTTGYKTIIEVHNCKLTDIVQLVHCAMYGIFVTLHMDHILNYCISTWVHPVMQRSFLNL